MSSWQLSTAGLSRCVPEGKSEHWKSPTRAKVRKTRVELQRTSEGEAQVGVWRTPEWSTKGNLKLGVKGKPKVLQSQGLKDLEDEQSPGQEKSSVCTR